MATLKQSSVHRQQPQTTHNPQNQPNQMTIPHLYQIQINQLLTEMQHLQHQLNEQKKQQHLIKVFWDYENCPLWSSWFKSICDLYYDINTKIDSVIDKKPIIKKQWELYGPPSCLMVKQIEDANTLNIHVTSIASKYKEETVDKRIIADIGLFATHCTKINAVGHLVLISGDRDYGYILGSYKNTPHIGTIILCHNEQAKATLLIHATRAFCLFRNTNTNTNDYEKKEDVLQPTLQSKPNKTDVPSAHNSKQKRKKKGTRRRGRGRGRGRGKGKSMKDC